MDGISYRICLDKNLCPLKFQVYIYMRFVFPILFAPHIFVAVWSSQPFPGCKSPLADHLAPLVGPRWRVPRRRPTASNHLETSYNINASSCKGGTLLIKHMDMAISYGLLFAGYYASCRGSGILGVLLIFCVCDIRLCNYVSSILGIIPTYITTLKTM